MVRRLWRPIMTVALTALVTTGAFFGIGAWRRGQDAGWCEKAVMGGTVAGDPEALTDDLAAKQRDACTVQRQRQRVMFGAVWRKDGTVMAQCGFDLARLQLLPDQASRTALLQRYGLPDDPSFDGVGLDEQARFIKACVATSRHN
ncbi:MAG: hypothetical protein LC792_01210 [Actinobacteria bacterium]|nr:hypothetical protein [Actinomycetota bacterium]